MNVTCNAYLRQMQPVLALRCQLADLPGSVAAQSVMLPCGYTDQHAGSVHADRGSLDTPIQPALTFSVPAARQDHIVRLRVCG
jgi:hypothetical protein